MQSHIRKVYACLVVTCHLRFWQNDRDLLRATAVTRGNYLCVIVVIILSFSDLVVIVQSLTSLVSTVTYLCVIVVIILSSSDLSSSPWLVRHLP